MSTSTGKDDRPVRPADLERARLWLVGHGLSEAPPTALLAKRLAVRQSTRLAGYVLLTAFILSAALIYSVNEHADDASGAPGPYPYGSLLLLTAVVAALVLAQALLGRRVRRIDRQAGAALPRRVAHPVRLGWRAVLGVPQAALTAATYAGAIGLTLSALSVREPGVRYAAAILLIGLCGMAAVMVVQLRHVLTHPAVAEDEDSLTADALMRVEDAREIAAPTAVWCSPWYLPAASAGDGVLEWWTTVWIVLIALGAVALALITLRAARNGTAVRRPATGR